MKDNHTLLGTLTTLTIQDFSVEAFEVGSFELEVTVETAFLMQAEDKRGYIIKTIGLHLASAIQETQVPSHLWVLSMAPRICKMIPSLPLLIVFGQ